MRISDWSSDVCSSDLTVPSPRSQRGLNSRWTWPQPGRPTGLLPIGIGVTTSDGFTQSKVQPENTVNALVDPAGLAPIAPIHCTSGSGDRQSTRLNSSQQSAYRLPSSAYTKKQF